MKNLKSILVICILSFFASSVFAFIDNTSPDEIECAPLSFEMFLPDNIAAEDVVSFEAIEMRATSSIYQIELADGSIFYEVLSSVTLEALPYVAKTACIGVSRSPRACDYVYRAGAALIVLFENELHSRVKSFWAAKISGNKGLASLFTSTLNEAREGQIAFENSRNETDYPWQSVDIIDYSDRNKRFGDH